MSDGVILKVTNISNLILLNHTVHVATQNDLYTCEKIQKIELLADFPTAF